MARVRGLLAVTGAALLAASGCSSGDEGKVVAAGDTAEAEVLSAIEATRATSGRFDMAVEPIGSEDFEGGVRGEFDGPDHLADSWEELGSLEYDDRTEADESDAPAGEDDPTRTVDRVLHVDDRSFVSFDTLAEMAGVMDEEDHDSGPAPDVDARIEWLETTELGSSDEHGMLEMLTFGSELIRPFAMLDELEAIESDGNAELEDGTATRRYTASISGKEFFEAMGFDGSLQLFPELPPDQELSEEELEDQRRMEAIERYGIDRTRLEVELHLDEAGLLRRTVVSVRSDIESDYADCLMLEEVAPAIRFSTDYSDLGDEIEIAVPDPDTVITPDAAIALFPDFFAMFDEDSVDEGTFEEQGDWQAPYFNEDGTVRTVQTVHGERVLAAVEDDLAKFGSVIDLDEEHVWEMTPEEMVEAYDRASAVLAGMPRTTTSMGDLTRVELLFNVRVGMEEADIDPSTADPLTDQQLGALIDQYVAQFGIAGDGVWGDPKVGDVPPEWWEEDFTGDEFGGVDEFEEFGDMDDLDDYYQGCPGASGGDAKGADDDAAPESAPAGFD